VGDGPRLEISITQITATLSLAHNYCLILDRDITNQFVLISAVMKTSQISFLSLILVINSCQFSCHNRIGILRETSDSYSGYAKFLAKHDSIHIAIPMRPDGPVANKMVNVWVQNLSGNSIRITSEKRISRKGPAISKSWITLSPQENVLVYSGPAFQAGAHVSSAAPAKIRIKIQGLPEQFKEERITVVGSWSDGP
jgi:hypothetical protein